MIHRALNLVLAAAALTGVAAWPSANAQTRKPTPPKSLRLYTPGHQSLFLKLAKTGPVLLSGDLYHYPEEMTYKRIPSFDFDMEQTAKSRAMIEEFVKKNNAQLWIQHDYTAGMKRKIAPEFYE
jgi:hypothetical protein